MVIIIAIIIGLTFGSAINGFVYRFASFKERELLSLLDDESLAVNDTFYDDTTYRARSFCDHCEKTLPIYTLIPVLSYILFKGQTHCCQQKIPLKYPFIEMLCGMWGLYCAYSISDITPLILISLYGYGLIALALCDIEYQLVSDNHIDMILVIVFLYLLSLPQLGTDNIYGYIAMYGIFKGLSLGYYALHHREGLGEGDVKMGGVIGLFHGVEQVSSILLYSSLSALIYTFICLLQAKNISRSLPFLPFLHGASFMILLQSQY